MSNVIHKRVTTKGTEDGLLEAPKSNSSPTSPPVLPSSTGPRRTKTRSPLSKATLPIILCLAFFSAVGALLHYETTKLLDQGGFKAEMEQLRSNPNQNQNEQVRDSLLERNSLEGVDSHRRSLFFNRSRAAYKYASLRPTTQRYLNRLEAFGRGNYGNCTVNATAWGREQVCCGVNHKAYPNKLYRWCLPGLVVMGSQKGGTTALHSYLMLHPNLEPSGKKELHAYDFHKNFARLPRKFPHNFVSSTNHSYMMQKVSFESTPSYMASSDACKRMSKLLPSSTVFVVILRDPVKRAWSELKMKERRVAAQEKYLSELFLPNMGVIYSCLRKRYKGRDIPEISETFVKEKGAEVIERHKSNRHSLSPRVARKVEEAQTKLLTNSSTEPSLARNRSKYRRGDFTKCLREARAMRLAKDARTRMFVSALARRVDRQAERLLPLCFRKVNEKVEWNRRCYGRLHVFLEAMPDLPKRLISEATDIASRCSKNLDMRQALNTWQETNFARKSRVERFTDAQNDCWLTHFSERCESCVNTNTCFPCFRKVAPLLNISACKTGTSNYRGSDSCKGPWCSCFPVTSVISDISKHFLWRGMYEIHLRNCLRYIPAERIVIVENEELRARPTETMELIQKDVGMPVMNYSSTTYAHAYNAFTKRYPSFEEQTGWSQNGTANSQPPPDVRQVLQEFYKRPNERLFRLIGRRFDHWS